MWPAEGVQCVAELRKPSETEQFILKYSQDLRLHGITPKPQHKIGESSSSSSGRCPLPFLVAILSLPASAAILAFSLNSNFILLHSTFRNFIVTRNHSTIMLNHSLHSCYQFILNSCCHALELRYCQVTAILSSLFTSFLILLYQVQCEIS